MINHVHYLVQEARRTHERGAVLGRTTHIAGESVDRYPICSYSPGIRVICPNNNIIFFLSNQKKTQPPAYFFFLQFYRVQTTTREEYDEDIRFYG
jgi:hypothetical protein